MRLHKPTFAPLLPTELPQPGALFALDAEFVAYSPPEKALLRCGGLCACVCFAFCQIERWRGRGAEEHGSAKAAWQQPVTDPLAACTVAGVWRWRCGAVAASTCLLLLARLFLTMLVFPCTRRGVEVEVRPSRLGLARVSLLRGQVGASTVPGWELNRAV